MTVFLSVADPSGDEHAANLMDALRARISNVKFVGVAGSHMAAAGCQVLADLTERASMLGGPLLRLGYYVRTIRRLQRQMAEIRPDLHVPVDSPAMNWHLAKTARAIGTPVVYYVAPQVWAWAPWRVRKLARLTDAVACILPFEQEYLRARGVNAHYVGHPIFDTRPPLPDPMPDLLDAWYHGTWRIALLPGSRPSEIEHHTHALLRVADALRLSFPKARCTFAAVRESTGDAIRRIVEQEGNTTTDLRVGRTSASDVLAHSHLAIAGSGTVTLQAAYFGVPMVVFYRTGLLTTLLHHTLGRFRSFVSTQHYSLVNILAGRFVVPEFMPWRGDTRVLVDTVEDLLGDLGYLAEARRNMIELVRPLVVPPPGRAADNAADLIVRTLQDLRGPK